MKSNFSMKDVVGDCPFATTQKILQGKWAILILHKLEQGPLRFNQLQRNMPKITHSTLSIQLKRLDNYGLVKRIEYPQIPPKVEYELTPIGVEFKKVLKSISDWGYLYIQSTDTCTLELLKNEK